MDALVAALSWNPEIKGGLYVVLAVLILCGSPYLILATNTGSRLGFQLAAAGLFGFLVIIGVVWWIYGIGPVGRGPAWEPSSVVTGDLGQSESDVVEGFPRDWDELELTDPAVADAQPVVDGALLGGDGQEGVFESSSEYVIRGAFDKGGEDYGPFGLDFRPFDVFHKPHYLAVQVQPVLAQPEVSGGTPARPEPDPNAEPVTVVMLRDLGTRRLNPGVATVSSALIFGLLIYQLHTRDKQAMAKAREKAGVG